MAKPECARGRGGIAVPIFLVGALVLATVAASAQPVPDTGDGPQKTAPQTAPPDQPTPPKPLDKDALRGVETKIEKSTFEQRRLAYEIENLSTEAQGLRTSLIDVARKVRSAEERLAENEGKLVTLGRQEGALRRSLQSRERVTAEVLAAMQRIGRKPPPALLVAPEDVLSAMRAAILLGAVLPDMRDEAMILVADLRTLSELRRQSSLATDQLRQERDTITAERVRMAGLIEARQSQINLSKEQLDQERARVATLTREARSLRDLIARSENEIVGNARATEIVRRAPLPARADAVVASLRPDGSRSAVRLQPRQAFSERRGQIPLPTSGMIFRYFGQPDGFGGTERGITISSNPSAVVIAPGDGWVHFAGPYRGYGHLLIINVGNGHHVVLAGMERLSVEIGQFVLAGEPVGLMGKAAVLDSDEVAKAALTAKIDGESGSQSGQNSLAGQIFGPVPNSALGASRPALYVEFRKDGSPVDPSPWWSLQSAEKARG